MATTLPLQLYQLQDLLKGAERRHYLCVQHQEGWTLRVRVTYSDGKSALALLHTQKGVVRKFKTLDALLALVHQNLGDSNPMIEFSMR
ncbi:hypothetical protein P2G88_18125 [Aliiglaciecola sp. CAU 1673]|uniref:hypothetical protein n=1 Tax=Aliiglaciecola sp. CAU 1673 TaxID=3032595 RepID=UPI0023DA312A|nr:hypothetical protein [Aliiglaciecola sp. CAU 1673]MDF2180176.1 hypothetical protein [Aliiglaciecola sp. CAU 1673]